MSKYVGEVREWRRGIGRDASEVGRLVLAAIAEHRQAHQPSYMNDERLAAAAAVGVDPREVSWDANGLTITPVGGGPGHRILRIFGDTVLVPNTERGEDKR